MPRFLGYIVHQFGIYGGRPASAYRHWQQQIEPAITEGIIEPLQYRGLVRNNDNGLKLADIRDYHALAPKAQESHKAIFELDTREAPGTHIHTVEDANRSFINLSNVIITRTA
jgi:hypothetical protein